MILTLTDYISKEELGRIVNDDEGGLIVKVELKHTSFIGITALTGKNRVITSEIYPLRRINDDVVLDGGPGSGSKIQPPDPDTL